jgi:hypothetical protein
VVKKILKSTLASFALENDSLSIKIFLLGGGGCHLICVIFVCFHSLNRHNILSLVIPNMTYFKEKHFTLSRAIYQIFKHKPFLV